MNNSPFIPAGKNNVSWMIFYIAVVIIFPKLFGLIPGIIGGILVVYGIQKIFSKMNLSKNKKIGYSILTVIGGGVVAIVISIILSIILEIFFSAN